MQMKKQTANRYFKAKGIKEPTAEQLQAQRRILEKLNIMLKKIRLDMSKQINEQDGVDKAVDKSNKAINKHSKAFIASATLVAVSLTMNIAKKSREKAEKETAELLKKIQNTYSPIKANEILKNIFNNSDKRSNINNKINKIVKQSIKENVALIKTLPETVKERIRANIVSCYQQGKPIFKNVQDIVNQASKLPEYRVKLITKNQGNRLNIDITKATLETVGVKYYVWQHSGISKEPRPMHLELSGTVQRWDSPPVADPSGERAHPQELINCNCYAVPLIEVNGELI